LCTADLYSKIADALKILKSYDRALVHSRNVLAIYQVSLGLDHPNSQEAQEEIGVVAKLVGLKQEDAHAYRIQATNSIQYEKNGYDLTKAKKYEQAITEYAHAIEIEESSLGKEHLTTAAICSKILDVYRLKGQYIRSILVYRNTIRIHMSNNAPTYDVAACTLHNLGLAVEGLGFNQSYSIKYQKVVRDALQHKEIGDAFRNVGDYGKAINEYRQAIAIEESVLGKLHPTTTALYKKIADIFECGSDHPVWIRFCQFGGRSINVLFLCHVSQSSL
jgi:tetratricopeptide (TPR) repeat protein